MNTKAVWDAIYTGKNAEPWVVHGVASVAGGATATNPTPSKVDVIGEITSLPYTVPQNRVLVLLSVQLSTDVTAASQCHVKIKVTRPGVSAVTHIDKIKYNESLQHNFLTGAWYPGGSILRVDLINATAGSHYLRFFIEGILVTLGPGRKPA